MTKFSILSVAFLCVVGIGLLFSDVSLAGAPACTGYSVQHPDADCFVSSLCAMENRCTTQKRWEVSDRITSAGNHNVQVTGFRPSGGTFTCQACATSREGFSAGCTQFVPLNVANADTQFTVGIVNVPDSGGLLVSCDMSLGAVYDSAEF